MALIRLKDIADLSYGRPVGRYERNRQVEGTRMRKSASTPVYKKVRVLTVPALETWPASAPTLGERELNVARAEKFFLKDGDIVVGLSSPFPSAYIDAVDLEGLRVYVPNSCAIVRVKEGINPWYLAGYLNLDETRKEDLPKLSPNRVAKLLSTDQLSNLQVKLPSKDEQAYLGNVYAAYLQLRSARMLQEEHEKQLIKAAFDGAKGGSE